MSATNRLAIREITAHPGRSWLIAALVALPVLVATATSVLFATQLGSLQRSLGQGLGSTAARISPGEMPDEHQRALLEEITAGHGGAVERVGSVTGKVRGLSAEIGVAALDTSDPRFEGRWLFDGSAAGGDVLLSHELMRQLGVSVGDAISLGGAEYPVGGTFAIDWLDWPGAAGVVVAPSHPLAPTGIANVLIDEPPSEEEMAAWSEAGLQVVDEALLRAQTEASAPSQSWAETVIGITFTALGSLVIASVVAAAFTISVRRQRRSLALLSATGAAPRTLRGVLLRTGLFLGLVGAALGVVVGLAGGAGGALVVNAMGPKPGFRIVVRWGAVAAFGAIGIVSAVLAAWFPARSVAKRDALAALDEAQAPMPRPRFPRAALVPFALGMVLLGAGIRYGASRVEFHDGTELATVLVASAGTMVLWYVAGVLAAPWVIDQLSRAVSAGWLSWRLALRDAARVGGRSVALVAASASTVALAVWAMTYLAAVGAHEIDEYSPTQPVGRMTLRLTGQDPSFDDAASRVDVVEELLGPAKAQARVSGPASSFSEEQTLWSAMPAPDEYGGAVMRDVVVGDEQLLHFTLGAVPSREAREEFERGKVIVFDEQLVSDGTADVHEMRYPEDATTEHSLPAVVAGDVPGMEVVISPDVAAGLGMEIAPSAVWLDYGPGVEEADFELAQEAVDFLGDGYWLEYEAGPHSAMLELMPLLTVAAATLASAVALVSMSLALDDGRETRASLATIGASAATLRRLAVAQAAVCVAMGGLLGAIVGGVPAGVAFALSTVGIGAVPWWQIAVLIVSPVLVVMAATAVFVRPDEGRAMRGT